ncbi:MAG: fluoride efflux transporter CrcB [Thiolinea sp.]
MLQIMAIMLGGAIGALLRYLTSLGVHQLLGRHFPYGTLTVNVLGSFLIGMLALYFSRHGEMETPLARGLIVGVLGALTTFSTFSLDTFYLLEQGAWLKAALNVTLNVLLCLLAVWLGVLTARAF